MMMRMMMHVMMRGKQVGPSLERVRSRSRPGKRVIVSEKSKDCVDAEHDVGVGREEARQQVHAMLGPSWQLLLCLANAPDWPPAF